MYIYIYIYNDNYMYVYTLIAVCYIILYHSMLYYTSGAWPQFRAE